eukprot:CAMPEP_0177641242 /NCGR_PEP_ID=MMETSP0447-20121125/6963_1 /TAXON_ID=0 /ORGANISM="Stygamoeba regulata, Strain BSH-02190019" /LENGTH=115 /DNA_ID=CAMNT_0019143349 /DNA_START=290 /DNA_END=637 /DNA_ORIENTATION=-
MGAKIGKCVFFDMQPPQEFDLLEIGNFSATCHDSQMIGHVIDHGRLQHSPILIGNYCSVGSWSSILPGCKLNDGVTVLPFSVGMKGLVVSNWAVLVGSPPSETQFALKEISEKKK